jgi:TM2 domain-containing membrane protein YozV
MQTGIHRFYLNRPISGIIWLLTGGLFGIGWLIDLCLIPGMVEEENIRYQQFA